MIKLVSLLNLRPEVSEEDFERYYREVHIPLARKLPGQRRYIVSKVRPSRRRQVPFYRMAENCFPNIEALRRALASPEAAATAQDAGFHSRVQDFVQFICEEEVVPLKG